MSFAAYKAFQISEKTYQAAEEALTISKPEFEKIMRLREQNQLRVISAFRETGLNASDFQFSGGYGYQDPAREKIEKIFAAVFSAEKALVRLQFSSGTQVLSTMLKGILRPYDQLLIATGSVYDTLKPTLGLSQSGDHASLKDFLVETQILELTAAGEPDLPALKKALQKHSYKAVYIQKSRGYSSRPALTNQQIFNMVKTVKEISPKTLILVDNCYGEFVESEEPTAFGADLIAGSLIKNPGGGIAPSGGYIAGKAEAVELCAEQMTASGVGSEIGPSLGQSRAIAQGFYLAPQIVANALQNAIFTAALFQQQGYEVNPLPQNERGDIVQTISFHDARKLITFCQAVQEVSPIDSGYAPVPAPMPGYDCDIIMASGSFTQGSSIELSADGPLRPPYTAFLQGGMNIESGRLASMLALERLWQED